MIEPFLLLLFSVQVFDIFEDNLSEVERLYPLHRSIFFLGTKWYGLVLQASNSPTMGIITVIKGVTPDASRLKEGKETAKREKKVNI